MSEAKINMAIVDFGYRKLVMPLDKAVALADILVESEIYEYKYHKDDVNERNIKTHHIFKPTDSMVGLEVISSEQYKMYKLAGAPKD